MHPVGRGGAPREATNRRVFVAVGLLVAFGARVLREPRSQLASPTGWTRSPSTRASTARRQRSTTWPTARSPATAVDGVARPTAEHGLAGVVGVALTVRPRLRACSTGPCGSSRPARATACRRERQPPPLRARRLAAAPAGAAVQARRDRAVRLRGRGHAAGGVLGVRRCTRCSSRLSLPSARIPLASCCPAAA